VGRVLDAVDAVTVLETFLQQGQHGLVVGLDQGDVALQLQFGRTLHNLVPPGKGLFLIRLGEVEPGNQPVHGAGMKDHGQLFAELQSSNFFVEALGELTSLLHFPQVPKD
jgi:hypothetical protein